MRASPWSSVARSAIVGVAGVVGTLLLFQVLVLAELVRANRRRCMSCGFVPRRSSWPSWLQPSAAKEPFRISASEGTLDVTSPVACHMPSGGLLLRKDWRIEEVLRLEGELVAVGEAPCAALPLLPGRCDVSSCGGG